MFILNFFVWVGKTQRHLVKSWPIYGIALQIIGEYIIYIPLFGTDHDMKCFYRYDV